MDVHSPNTSREYALCPRLNLNARKAVTNRVVTFKNWSTTYLFPTSLATNTSSTHHKHMTHKRGDQVSIKDSLTFPLTKVIRSCLLNQCIAQLRQTPTIQGLKIDAR